MKVEEAAPRPAWHQRDPSPFHRHLRRLIGIQDEEDVIQDSHNSTLRFPKSVMSAWRGHKRARYKNEMTMTRGGKKNGQTRSVYNLFFLHFPLLSLVIMFQKPFTRNKLQLKIRSRIVLTSCSNAAVIFYRVLRGSVCAAAPAVRVLKLFRSPKW